jgi:hypothetical protein
MITSCCSGVLILLLGVRAITYEMPWLSTVVAKVGQKSLGLRNLWMCLWFPLGLRTTMGKLIHQLLK